MRLPFPILFLLFAALTAFPAGAERTGGKIVVLTVKGPITPAVAEYVDLGFDYGREVGASLLLIELDTPGGLDKAMRSINSRILNSPFPVAVFVSPSGARAASAGTFITLAADVAAMAPSTTIGAAHPVQLMGKSDETMSEKVVNDSAAYMRSLAERHGRNGDWAEEAVRESVSLTEQAALDGKVIDLLAEDIDALLKSLEGWKVGEGERARTLRTEGLTVVRFPMDFRRRFLNTLSDPNIAYLLLLLGMIGIFFEFSNPGSIYPGVIGVIAIILALYSLQTLPVNYAGLLLIVLAVVLFIIETQVASYGLLSLGGIVSLFIGSIMLVRAEAEWLRISYKVIFPSVAFTAAFFLIVLQRVVAAHKRRPATGSEGLVGEEGEVLGKLDPAGKVFLKGEIWDARCDGGAERGERIRVVDLKGLTLTVEKCEGG